MKKVNYIIKEVIPIIIGILIALFINNWNEDRKDKKYLNQMFSSIESELEESSIDLKIVIPKQLASVDTLEAYLNNEKVTIRNNNERKWYSDTNHKNEFVECYC